MGANIMWYSLRSIARKASMDGSEENLDRSYGTFARKHSPLAQRAGPQFEERFLLGLVLGFLLVQEARVMMRCT
jgi:hypothetical protein